MVLLAAISGLLIAVGGLIGGPRGALTFLVISVALSAASYWFSVEIVLRSSGAREVSREQEPQLFALVGQVAERVAVNVSGALPRVCRDAPLGGEGESPAAGRAGRAHAPLWCGAGERLLTQDCGRHILSPSSRSTAC